MNEETAATESLSPTKSKPGPKPKPKVDNTDLIKRIEELEATIENLTRCLEHTATNSGQGNTIVAYGLKRYIPTKGDMNRWKG